MRIWLKKFLQRRFASEIRLVRAIGVLDSARYLFASRFQPHRILDIRVNRRKIAIRVASPDLDVAISCLTGEFDELIAAAPKPDHSLVVDAGGYIGTAAIVFSESYPESVVLSLEPNSENFEILKRNTANYANVIAINKALAPSAGKRPMRNRNTGQWGFTLVSDPADAPSAKIVENVDCVTVEDLLEEYGFEGIGILKLDIEGGEHALLAEAPEWLSRTEAICIELHDRIMPGCSDIFYRAVQGRDNFRMRGEKHVSILRKGFSRDPR